MEWPQRAFSSYRELLPRRSLSRFRDVLILLIGFSFGVHPAYAAYVLDSGDVLTISVFDEEPYPVEVTIDDDGKISLPLLGEVTARGLTTAQLRDLMSKSFQAGEIFLDPFIQIAIKGYRPFYISGAVGSPGAYPFRPNMTVRHAISIAGGFKVDLVSGETPAFTIAELRSEYEALLIEVFRRKTELERLRSELQGEALFTPSAALPPQIDPDLLSEIVESEAAQLEARRLDLESDLGYIDRALASAREDLATIEGSRAALKEIGVVQLEELQTARVLKDKGLTTNSNLLDAQRAQSLHQSDVAEFELRYAQMRSRVSELEKERDQRLESHTIGLITQIQEAELALGTAENRMKHVREKMTYVAMYGSHRRFEELRSSIEIRIHREVDGQSEVISADENTLLAPDDLMEITVRPNEQFFTPEPDLDLDQPNGDQLDSMHGDAGDHADIFDPLGYPKR